MRFPILIIFIFLTNNLCAQKKISFDLSLGVLKSLGRDINSTYKSNNYAFPISYQSRSRFKNPYLNVLGRLNYSVNSRLYVGIQSGFYVHFAEKFISNVRYTKVAVPALATLSYEFSDITSNSLGISISVGKLYYSIDEFRITLKNATIYNVSAIYHVGNKSFIEVGLGRQVDNVTLMPDGPEYPQEKFKYHLKRVSLSLSYGFKFGTL